MAEKTYLGDGAYAELMALGGDVRLTTEDGISTTNSIYLGPHEFEALVRYVKVKPTFADAIGRAMA